MSTEKQVNSRLAVKYGIPKRYVASIMRYVRSRINTGSFLRAVLANDLFDAYGRADPPTISALPRIVKFIFNEVPGPAWGSTEKVDDWIAEENEWQLQAFANWQGESRSEYVDVALTAMMNTLREQAYGLHQAGMTCANAIDELNDFTMDLAVLESAVETLWDEFGAAGGEGEEE